MSASVSEPTSGPLTIVAIGASAGGLDPIKDLLRAVTPAANVCYVVITHLPVAHISHLAELLGRVTSMPVAQVADREKVTAGQVHVVPPGTLMGIRAGAFYIDESAPKQRPLRPIDYFMASLADEAPEHCIGVVLSGSDHDGTAGLRAIRSAGGLAVVQTPEHAQFPSMPQSAIAAGAADCIAEPADIPEVIRNYLAHVSTIDLDTVVEPSPSEANPTTDVLHDLLAIVEAHTGTDFRWYRQGMLRRRLRRRMSLHGLDRLSDYRALLEKSTEEVDALKSEFLIGVTEFFRDPEAWSVVETEVLPTLAEEHRNDETPIRVWTPGCATGEESYSIAMLLLEKCASSSRAVQVFASDLDEEALAVARKGIYHESIASSVSAERLHRFFERRGENYAVRKELRDAVLFAPQNLLSDTPFSKLDLVICRNVLIYLEPVLQQRALDMFHFALRPRGFLLLGKAETLGSQTGLFEPASPSIRLFRRIGARSRLPAAFAGIAALAWGADRNRTRRTESSSATPAEFLREHMAGRIAIASVLVDHDGRALHFDGDIDRYLHLSGDASWELSRLMRPELRRPIRLVLRQAMSQSRPVQYRAHLEREGVREEVLLRAEPTTLLGRGLAVVTFTEPNPAGPRAADGTDLVAEDTSNELVLALEDAERSNEDLRTAHEEAVLLNEELQSSNEELESSKEELQSMIEELSSVNVQLEEKILEVGRRKDDLANLIHGTQIAAVMLDAELRITQFTPTASALFSFKAGDEGRLLSDISRRVKDAAFDDDLASVMHTAVPRDKELSSSDGRIFLRRIQPYIGAVEGPQGVVITYMDVTTLRDAAQQASRLLAVLEDSNDAVMVLDHAGAILEWNSGAEALYGYPRAEAVKLSLLKLVPSFDHEATVEMLRHVSSEGRAGPMTVRRCTRAKATILVSATASAIRDASGKIVAILSTERDITREIVTEREMYFRRLADRIPALLRVDDIDGDAQFVNSAFEEFTGRKREELLGDNWLKCVHPEDRQSYVRDVAQAVVQRRRFETDLRMRRRDGVYRWMRLDGAPHFDSEDQFAGFVSITTDTEERKRAETALLLADRRKDEYLAMLAHELRNPLAPIRNAVAVVTRAESPALKIDWAMGVVERQTDALGKLLDDLLDVARVASGKVTLAMVPVEVAVVVERAVETMRPLFESRRQQVSVNLASQDVTVEGDLMRLVQVVSNLINNASKYSDEGGHINLVVFLEESTVAIRVRDDGAGMSKEFLPHVFDMFAQADRTLDRAKGGLGLGLTLAYQIVQLHGGELEADSPGLGLGSEFTVRLPLYATASALQPRPQLKRVNVSGIKQQVLVVDDNRDAAESLSMLLQMEGHEVTVAFDGDTALAMAEANPPDILILDIGLPGIDGYEVARRLRGRAKTAHVKLIAVSGYGQTDDIAHAIEVGFDHHFVKPVEIEALLAVLTSNPVRGLQ